MPVEQGVHCALEEAPVETPNVPAAHRTHVLGDVAAKVPEYVPARQAVQVVDRAAPREEE